ncbi:two-component system sensor histidine kinase/response regulator [Geomonas limicola]|uniref:histidine kinase n=1 Tax=Geomonas limicola TaxID=2740186 RepID=A0A6V8NAT4_9BACT|nr:response regulator [Geomonas limicola]GFO69606.1 two-component system sensor histidine kinase/response regulator [Geomonas limicola]
MLKTRSRKPILSLAFAVALSIFLIIGWQVHRSMEGVREADLWENHTYQVLSEVDLLFSAVKDAETGQRGFIITGLEEYLEPYRDSLGVITTKEHSLRNLSKDNARQLNRLDRIETLVRKRLETLDQVIEMRRLKGLDAAVQLILTHSGRIVMDQIRAEVDDFRRTEKQLLEERSQAKSAGLSRTLAIFEAGTAVGFIILVLVFVALTREIAQRSRTEADLEVQNEQLRAVRDREQAQNWIKGGLNELNQNLRGDKTSAALSGDALTFVASYLKAGAAALYLYDDRSTALKIAANYAYTQGRALHDSIHLGEGVAGEAARERRMLVLDELPPNYLMIGSALGQAVPRSLVALPLTQDERLVGVLELATFRALSDLELDFLVGAAENVAVALSVSQARQQVNELLLQSQAQEEELRVQQEELQQSNEELEERAQLLEQQRTQIQGKNREIERASQELAQKARDLEQASNYKSEFLANMSHELRTPLNSLLILSGQLQENREGNLTAKQVEYAATIKGAGSDLLNLINDILDLSKVEAGRLEFVYRESNLRELGEQVAAALEPQAAQKELSFATRFEPELPERVVLDLQRTQQVLKNLLSNAIKFTSQGGVTLRVYLPERARNPLPVPAVAFEVKDSGIGIPAEKHEAIFQAFRQADGSTSRKYGGTGLGLSISRQLARGMHGEILLESGLDQGSTFTLYLPLDAEAAGTTPPPAAGTPPAGQVADGVLAAPPLADDRDRVAPGERCILIVEDDLSFAQLLMEKVHERGFSAIVAADGPSGVILAERYLPSAILLDVLLPGLDGWGVMQKLTDNLRTRHIPVHFLTCLEEKQKGLAMGAIGFGTKPLSLEQLDLTLAAIESAVERTSGKVLIVEDDPAEATALHALLEGRDIAISQVANGREAIELLTRENFDCVVLDLGLADMSGYQVLEHLHHQGEERRVPVIIHTGQELSSEETAKLQRYAESVIIKGAKSPERLLNEVTLFLHVMESRLPPEKRHMIRTTLDNDTLLAGKKVLVVDDDMRNVFSLASALGEKGMQVVEAENGRAALERLAEQPDVDIVLMDIMMPEMDGYQAIRLIRQDPRFSRLPVIALTAKAMKGDREACLKAGASDYITKPVDLDRLLSLLRVWLYHQG